MKGGESKLIRIGRTSTIWRLACVRTFMEVKTYTKGCEHYDTENNGRMCYGGIRFDCDLFTEVAFAKRGYTGDIRDLLPKALKEIKWPTDPKRYFLLQTNGEFWDRPSPMGVRSGS